MRTIEVQKKESSIPQIPCEYCANTIEQKKTGLLKAHPFKGEASKLPVDVSHKAHTHTGGQSETQREGQQPFKEEYRGALNLTPKQLPNAHKGDEINAPSSDNAEHYEPSRIVLMDVDPYCLYAYWEINPSDKESALVQREEFSHPPTLIMRVYDVTHINFDGINAYNYFDIQLDRDKGNWYIDLWSSHKSLYAEIGMKSSEGSFYPIVPSNFVETPRDQSSSGEEQWMKVLGDYEEISLLSLPPRETEVYKPELKSTHLPPLTHTEEIEGGDTFTSEKKEILAPEPQKTYHPSCAHKETIECEDTTSTIRKEEIWEPKLYVIHTPPRITTLSPKDTAPLPQDFSLFATSHSPRERTAPEKKVTKSAIKKYYHRFIMAGRRCEEKVQGGSPSEEKHHEKLYTLKHTYFGSGIRWEEETIRLQKVVKKNYTR